MRVLLLDIETMPDMREVMKHITQLSNWPGLTLKASINSVLCFGYMWSDEKKPTVISAFDNAKTWSKDINDDKWLLEQITPIIGEADVVVTHNGKSFDWRFLQTRLLKHGMSPLREMPHVDTKNLSKQKLFLLNNKLDTVAKHMTSEEKLENGGWDLWVRVSNRDEAAQKLMAKYCAQDVKTLYAVYQKLRPFINNMPNYNIVRETEEFVCPKCGSTRIQSRGHGYNRQGQYQRVHCKDCFAWSSMRKDKAPK